MLRGVLSEEVLGDTKKRKGAKDSDGDRKKVEKSNDEGVVNGIGLRGRKV